MGSMGPKRYVYRSISMEKMNQMWENDHLILWILSMDISDIISPKKAVDCHISKSIMNLICSTLLVSHNWQSKTGKSWHLPVSKASQKDGWLKSSSYPLKQVQFVSFKGVYNVESVPFFSVAQVCFWPTGLRLSWVFLADKRGIIIIILS